MKILAFVMGLLFLPIIILQAQNVEDHSAYIELQAQGSGGTIGMGKTAELAKFRLSNRSGKNISLNRLTLRNYGTADLDESFENYVVKNNNRVISTAVQVDRNNVTFSFEKGLIARGEALQLSVVARLIYAPSRQTVKLGIRRQEDVQASIIGLDYFSLECRECESIKGQEKNLRAGGLNIRNTSPYASARFYGSSRSTSSYNPNDSSLIRKNTNTNSTSSLYSPIRLGRQPYSPGSKDIQFFSTDLNSKVSTQVEGVFLSIGSGSNASDKNKDGKANQIEDFSASFSDFNLYVNNQQVDSTDAFVSFNGRVGLLFDSTFEIPPQSNLVLTGRITQNAVNGDRVRFSLNRTGLIHPTYTFSGDTPNYAVNNGGY